MEKLKEINHNDLPNPQTILSSLERNKNFDYLIKEHNKIVVAVNMLLEKPN